MADGDDQLREEGAKALEALRGTQHTEEEMAARAAGVEAAEVEVQEEVKDLDPRTATAKLADLKEALEPTPEEAHKIREAKKARIAQVMSGGILNERLQAIYDEAVPPGMRGKFVLDKEDFIIRYRNLGYGWEYNEGASGLHDTSDGRIRAGDLVLMTIAEEDFSILDEVRSERVKQKLSQGRDEFHRQMHNVEGEGTAVDDSDTQIITTR